MPWNQISVADVLGEFTPAEKATLQAIQAADFLPDLLARVLGQARGSIAAGGYAVGEEGTIPDQLTGDVVALTRWRLLISFPQMKALQTEDRRKAAERAEERFDLVANQKLNVEAPASVGSSPASNWNSENKIVPRAHPVPRPGTQYQGTNTGYSNPDGPADQSAS